MRLIGAFIVALVTAGVTTPVAIMYATRTGFHDQPVGYKAHGRPTPYLGGAAVLLAFLLAAFALGGSSSRVLPIALGAFGLWMVGTVDDRRFLAPWVRVAAEAVAAAALWATGLGWSPFDSDIANLLLTTLWVVGLVNAFNLMDNTDGAAATVAAVTGLCIAGIALAEGDPAIAALALGLAGACMGFLPYNLAAPARIFLGDGGSIPIGFVVAASLMALWDTSDWNLLISASMLAGLPILDTALVMISRRRRGVPLMTGGRDHLTHRLQSRLGSTRAVAVALAVAQGLLGAAAIATNELGREAVLVAGFLCFALAGFAVALMETGTWAHESGAPAREAPVAPAAPGGRRSLPNLTALETATVVLIAAACGLSPFFYGFYEVSVWGPITLVLLAVLLGLVVARPAVPSTPALASILGLAGLWVWGLASTAWAESADQATLTANRWLFYAALFAVLVLLIRRDSVARAVIISATAAVVLLLGYLVVTALIGDGPDLFLGSRLNEPLGYVNGQAGYLLLGLWPLIAAAEFARRPAVAGAALGTAVLLAAIVLLCQTRAVIPAIVISAAVILIFVPGRIRRIWALAFLAAAVAAVAGPLVDVTQGAGETLPDASDLRSAVVGAIVVAVAAGVAWGVARHSVDVVRKRSPAAVQRAARRSGVVLVAFVLATAVVVAATADPLDRARREANAFTELRDPEPGQSRLTSGAGNRYDYWRIAWQQFRERPVRGFGAGNYDVAYFQERRTTENVRQAHSIELQILGELGLVGFALLGLFAGGILWGFARHTRGDRGHGGQSWAAVAAGGVFVTWLVHTSIDWLHLIPGVTGVALCSAAVLVGPWQPRPARPGSRARTAVVMAGVALVSVGAIFVGRSVLADHYLADGRDALRSDPHEALSDARAALDVDDEIMKAYYLESAAHARLGRYQAATAALREAVRREPHDFLPWALLGDLATRRGEPERARNYYARAAALNPRDPAIRAMAEQ